MKITTLATITLTSFISGGLFTACERQETERAYFATFEQAVDQGAVGEGRLLPPILPDSATSIEYAFNIDTNDAWVTFRFNSQDVKELTSKCGGRFIDDYSTGSQQSPLKTWPAWLAKGDARPEPPMGWAVWHCANGGYIAVNSEAGTAAYWRKG